MNPAITLVLMFSLFLSAVINVPYLFAFLLVVLAMFEYLQQQDKTQKKQDKIIKLLSHNIKQKSKPRKPTP